MIRRILCMFGAAALCITSAVPAAAQLNSFGTGSYAIDFNYSMQSQSANNFTFAPYSVCQQTSGSTAFFPFNLNAPVFVQDITAANSERLVPSSIIKTSASCGVVVAPANQHYSFRLTSATAGLQEAINTIAPTTLAYPRFIIIDARWKSQITSMGLVPATVLGQVTGNTKAVLLDITAYTSGRFTTYTWNGTAYVAG